MSKEQKAETIRNYLAQTTGSDQWFRHGFARKFTYTSGVNFVAETAGAYWLIDAILSHQPKAQRNPRLAEFQIWFLRKKPGTNQATLSCYADTGKGERAVIQQRIEYTDFPLDEIKLYVENYTVLLPEER